jgi:hypothetical protein
MDHLVPWYEQSINTYYRYKCGQCGMYIESFRAINDIPRHASLCAICHIDDPQKEDYIHVKYVSPSLYPEFPESILS